MKQGFSAAFLFLGILCAPVAAEERAPSRPVGREDKAGREAWFWQQRGGPAGRVPAAALRRSELARRASTLSLQPGDRTAWESIGPDPILHGTMVGGGDVTYAGRALAVAMDPAHSGTLLMGAAQGGIWRSTDSGKSWAPVGDELPSLAIKVIRFAPSDPSVVYAGSGEPHSKTSIWGMGVFKSTDGGRSWTDLPASGKGWDFRFLAVSGLQVHPRDPKTLWVTTANVLPDRVNSFEPPPDAADPGVFRSTDGGRTWRRVLAATDYRKWDYAAYDPYLASGWGFVDLELFQKDPRILFAVERSGGIYRTMDGGESWKLCTPQKSPGKGAASGADFPAPVKTFSTYDDATGTFRSLPVVRRGRSVPEFNRVEIGIGQAGGAVTDDWHTGVIYAGYGAVLQLDLDGDGIFDPKVDLSAPTALLFRSADGGETWRWLGDWFLNGIPHYCDVAGGNSESAMYDNTVEVNPLNPLDVLVAGNANYASLWPDPVAEPTRLLQTPWTGTVFRSQDGGTTWVDTTPVCLEYVRDEEAEPIGGLPLYRCARQSAEKGTHPDTHAAAFDWPNRRFLIAGDGGLYECTVTGDGTNGVNDYTWRDINGNTGTLQVFEFGSHPSNPDMVLVGMQDNSNAYWNGRTWEAWDWNMSDGTVARWDPKSPRHVYLGMQYSLARHDRGGGPAQEGWKVLFDGTIGKDDVLPFVVVFAIDPVATHVVYVGSVTGVYRSRDRGDHWAERLNANPTDGQVTTIAVSPRNPRFVWAGTSTGHVYLFDTKKGDVVDKTGNHLPNRWVSAIVPSAASADKAVIAFSGYDANSADVDAGGNGNVGRVFRTSDRGDSWRDISGNLVESEGLDVPATSLVQHPKDPDRLWLGTDYGVFQSLDGGKRWRSVRGNMPIVSVTALEINSRTGFLLAATFGRGVWRIPYGR